MNEKTILLVEDNPDDEELTLLAFKRNNIVNQINVVRDGAEALDYLFGRGIFSDRTEYPMPTVILMDLNLPKLSGLSVLRELRSHDKTRLLPVVILTSSNEEQDIFRGYNFGANSYIRKPVNFDKFIEAVKQLGLYWLTLNQPIQTGVS